MNRGRVTSLLAGLVVIATSAWLLWPNTRPMPAVTFNLVDGGRIDSADLRGRSLLVNFWSVSCTTCLRDMPRLAALQQSLPAEKLSVIGVAMPYDPPPAVMTTVARLQPTYPIAFDVHGELSRAFGDIRVTPTSFLIDPSGNIRYAERGQLDETRVRATLATF
ncbi:MAG: TlpA family protein disulfide reductase [Gammaproteobacteria bacterium]|nr:TlpA family protein disulfide reductase [Gammaproteobacteria bacterium]